MPRKRMLDPGIWTNEDFGNLPPLAQVYCIGLISNADDAGRTKAGPAYLKAVIRPYGEETPEDVIEALYAIYKSGIAEPYEAGGGWYAVLPNWSKYQTIQKPTPSKLPTPNGSEELPEVIERYCRRTVGLSPKRIEEKGSNVLTDMPDNSTVQEIFDLYKRKINGKSRLTEGAKRKIKSRLRVYSVEELRDAVQRFSDTEWWMENNAHRGIAWFFNSDDRIDQFLNLKPKIETPKTDDRPPMDSDIAPIARM